MSTLTAMPRSAMDVPEWRAALVILCGWFGRDRAVWAHVSPGDRLDLGPLIADAGRSVTERTLLGFAQGLVDGDTHVPTRDLCGLPEAGMRLVIDALAIVAGRVLPID